jgi:hypothetical protein
MDTLDYALKWASMGIPVLPLHENSKIPTTPNGFYDATTEPEQLKAWFGEGDCNLGIRTGQISGIIGIDIDRKNGLDGVKSLEQRYGERFLLPKDSMLCKTANGGWHIIIRHASEIDVPCGTNVLGLDGVDIRGNGGFIVAAPSKLIIDGQATYYRVNDINRPITEHYGWITELLTEFKQNKRRSHFDPGPVMSGTSQGSRNSTLFAYSRHLFARGMELGLVMGFVLEAANRCTPPLSQSEARTIVNNAFRYNKNMSTPPSNPTIKDVL